MRARDPLSTARRLLQGVPALGRWPTTAVVVVQAGLTLVFDDWEMVMRQSWKQMVLGAIAVAAAITIDVVPALNQANAATTGTTPATSGASGSGSNNMVLAQASGDTIEELRAQIIAERRRTDELEARLRQIEEQQQAQRKVLPRAVVGGRGKEVTPGITTGLQPADIYNKGFYVKTEDNSFSMYVNALLQTRFTEFKPNSVGQFGSGNRYENTFDLFLGRLAFSGNVLDPDTKYFFQIQGSTAGNSNTISLLDWFAARTIAPYLTLQVGRSWIPYTYEYYDNPGNYLFPDLSGAEYAFLLQRAIGVQAYGQYGKLGYGAGVYNSIPALDASGQESINGKLAYTGNVFYDILAPYGWIETDPSEKPVTEPELTFWMSGMYNPVDYSSGLENELSGDRTFGGTSSILFRYNYLSFQGTGYYRRTLQTVGLPSYDSWGYGEQAGYYLMPGRVELAERITGVWWGAPEIPATGGNQVVWFDGPTNFSYNRITEYSVGLNLYLHKHNAKIQTAYSYLAGAGFTNSSGFGANRLEVQAQLMF
jgi:hypothetical protein